MKLLSVKDEVFSHESEIMNSSPEVMPVFSFGWKQLMKYVLFVSFDTPEELIISLSKEFVNWRSLWIAVTKTLASSEGRV